MATTQVKTISVTAVVAILVLGAVGVIIIYSGAINIAASRPHNPVTKWILMTTMKHSVERRATMIAVPENFRPGTEGSKEYREMCELCHGGVGKKPSAIGKGLRPEPPELLKIAMEASTGEIFWVVKNGVRMSGMPSFGQTHDDDKLWKVVSFVKLLPQISADEYARLVTGS